MCASSQIHKKKYDYSLVEYKSSQHKVTIICPIHGSFNQSPTAHVHQQQGCPACGILNRKNQPRKKTNAQFIKEANNTHNQKYTYEHAEYINIKSKIIVTCHIHGDFEQEAKAHLRGQGCPVCANERRAAFYESCGEKKIEQFLLEHDVFHVKQKTFDNCRYKMLLRFDFFLPNYNTLIEFDGEQHHKFVRKFHRNQEGFKRTKVRDSTKNDYATDNNITLIHIPWFNERNIYSILSNIISQ